MWSNMGSREAGLRLSDGGPGLTKRDLSCMLSVEMIPEDHADHMTGKGEKDP